MRFARQTMPGQCFQHQTVPGAGARVEVWKRPFAAHNMHNNTVLSLKFIYIEHSLTTTKFHVPDITNVCRPLDRIFRLEICEDQVTKAHTCTRVGPPMPM